MGPALVKPGDRVETPLGAGTVVRITQGERWIAGRPYPIATIIVQGQNGLSRVFIAKEVTPAK